MNELNDPNQNTAEESSGIPSEPRPEAAPSPEHSGPEAPQTPAQERRERVRREKEQREAERQAHFQEERGRREEARRQREEERREPVRRVGTLTMGAALIITGIVALILMFVPSFDMTLVFKLSPLIFIFLGIEILTSYFFHKGVRLKYDFLSCFVCFLLITAGGCLAVAPTIMAYVGPPAFELRDRVNREIEDEIYETLRGGGQIVSMHSNVDLPYYHKYDPDASLEAVSDDVSLYVQIMLAGPFPTKESFAEAAIPILRQLGTMTIQPRNLNIDYWDSDGRHIYQLSVNDRFQMDMDADALLSRIDVYRDDYDEDEPEYEDEPTSEARASADGSGDLPGAGLPVEAPTEAPAETASGMPAGQPVSSAAA